MNGWMGLNTTFDKEAGAKAKGRVRVADKIEGGTEGGRGRSRHKIKTRYLGEAEANDSRHTAGERQE